MLQGILVPSNMAAKTTFCLDLVVDSYAQMCRKRSPINFLTFSLKFEVQNLCLEIGNL